MVAASDCIALMPRYTTDISRYPELILRPLSHAAPGRHIDCLARPETLERANVKAVLAQLKTIIDSLSRRHQDELSADLNSPSGQDEYLMVNLAGQAESSGIQLNAGEVYSFRVPPVLGGAIDLSNIEVSEFVVTLDIAGHIHQQVLTLPPGTPITGITLS